MATAKKPAKVPVKPKSPAEWAHDRLVLYIRNFEGQLDATQEVAMGLAGDETGVLRIEGIGFQLHAGWTGGDSGDGSAS